MSFWTGSPESFEQRSRLGKSQQPAYEQLQASIQGPGAGGAFGESADYYRSLLNDQNSTYNALAAPELRQFREQIIPGLSEQFAGMGAGGLSSSGFQNATVNAGTDLSERLGAIRANLRQQGAQGLMGLGQFGLGDFYQNIHRPATTGALDSLAPLIGTAVGAFGGPIGAAAGGAAANWISQSLKGKSSPYGESAPDYSKSGTPSQITAQLNRR